MARLSAPAKADRTALFRDDGALVFHTDRCVTRPRRCCDQTDPGEVAGHLYLELRKKASSEGRTTPEFLQLHAVKAFVDRLATSERAEDVGQLEVRVGSSTYSRTEEYNRETLPFAACAAVYPRPIVPRSASEGARERADSSSSREQRVSSAIGRILLKSLGVIDRLNLRRSGPHAAAVPG